MSSPSYFEESHLLAVAPTGFESDFGGKTAWSTWFVDNWGQNRDLVIYLNVKHDDVARVLDWAEVGTLSRLADAMADGHRRIVFTPADHDWEAVTRRLRDFVRALPSDTSKLVVLDEVPELDQDAVLTFTRVMGNECNCQAVLLAQSPTDVDGSILKCACVVWVGLIKESYQAWFRTHDWAVHFNAIRDTHAPYYWSVITGPDVADLDTYEPVPERYAEI